MISNFTNWLIKNDNELLKEIHHRQSF